MNLLKSLIFACLVLLSEVSFSTIYGEDTRLDRFEFSTPSVLALSSSSVALISPSTITPMNDRFVKLQGPTLAASESLCSGERFENQPVLALCSGVLIAKDIVLTAGHCVPNEEQCQSTKFVFGLELENETQIDVLVTHKNIYDCGELLYTQSGNAKENIADFALIRLARPVDDHPIAKIDRSSKLLTGTKLMAFGYPNGIPLKYIDGNIRSNNLDLPFFVTNLGSFNRNSGSPVFDSETGGLQGILFDGEEDFVLDGQCFRAKHCSLDGCHGESVTRILAVLPILDQLEVQLHSK